MNKLTFKSNKENGLSIELYIDGISIKEIFPDVDILYLPYHLFDGDLPYFPLNDELEDDPLRRIIGVCECGEYGCNNINCRVEEKNGMIIWNDFKCSSIEDEIRLEYSFDKNEYKETIFEMLKIVNDYKKSPA